MLKHRVLTAMVLIPLVVYGLFVLSTHFLAIIFGAIILVATKEWLLLFRINTLSSCFLIFVSYLALMVVGDVFYPNETFFIVVMTITFLWWIVASLDVFSYERGDRVSLDLKGDYFDDLWAFLKGSIVLIPPWIAVIYIHGSSEYGPNLVLVLFLLIWGADSGAYFIGRQWGKTKLAPRVSPGKSWEGIAGGLLTSLLVGIVSGYLLEFGSFAFFYFLFLSILTFSFSVVGDLYESILKRRRGVKDSGHILPGHGGILDRIDSLTSAAPIFALGLFLMGGSS